MNFIWKMTEQNWKNMMHDYCTYNYDDMSNDYNFYGQMYCGDFCVEFLVDYVSDNENIMFTNIYKLYDDTGYGETKEGIPYDLIDEYIDIKKANSFDEFKKNCEKSFERIVILKKWEQYANKKCDWDFD